jgi:glutamine---fructose-6-phosphate transaminase (isomerizing)
MCGIVGYIGSSSSVPVIINGLSKLEYRGYDSAGICVHDGSNLNTIKSKGRVSFLADKLEKTPLSGSLAIGHTRWATHGQPSDLNSHPHLSNNKTIAVVHNGIIENYLALKDELIKNGYSFISETDTEVIANLIEFYYLGGMSFTDALLKAASRLIGTFALGVIFKDQPETLLSYKKDSPLIIGVADGEHFIASDIPALLKYTKDIYFLEDYELAILTKDSVKFFDKSNNPIKKELITVDLDVSAAEKEGYEHFMIKETHDQPKAITDTLRNRLLKDGINLDNVKLNKKELESINRIYIVACGTAYHAGLIGKNLIENIIRIPVVAEIASEFRFKNPMIDKNTLVIVTSQSGETADTIASIKLAKEHGAKVLAIVNVVGSTISRMADDVLYTLAGPEISVASTKAYSTQVAAMYLLVLHMGLELNKISLDEYSKFKDDLEQLPSHIEHILTKKDSIKALADKYIKSKNTFFIGRGIDYLVAMEASLKIKEIAYIHSEAFPSGELKHGSIALVEDSTLLVGIMTQQNLFDKTLGNLIECQARGASILAITTENNTEAKKYFEDVFYIPTTNEFFASILANVPLQLFAYYTALGLGCDIDMPRNLAKSVTV